jgi:hypothetical protein
VLAEYESENCDSRRMLFLKSQNAQLQRQCHVMSSALGKRSDALANCEQVLGVAHDVLKNDAYSPSLAAKTAKQIAQVCINLQMILFIPHYHVLVGAKLHTKICKAVRKRRSKFLLLWYFVLRHTREIYCPGGPRHNSFLFSCCLPTA